MGELEAYAALRDAKTGIEVGRYVIARMMDVLSLTYGLWCIAWAL